MDKLISVSAALSMLGKGEPSMEVISQTEKIADEIKKVLSPVHTYREFGLLEDGVLEGACFFLEGEDIKKVLLGCQSCILIAATLGFGVERLLLGYSGNPAGLVILDALLNCAVERYINAVCAELKDAYNKKGLYLTDRFAPGYGDMPLNSQESLLRSIDAERRIGVTVSPSGVMIPQKTITGVIGVSNTPKQHLRPCDFCRRFGECELAQNGGTCGI